MPDDWLAFGLASRTALAALSALTLAACTKPRDAPRAIEGGTAQDAEPSASALAERAPRVASTSRTVDLRIPFGGRESQEIRLVGLLARDAHLALDAVGEDPPEVEILPGNEANPPALRLTKSGTRTGHGEGELRVTTGLPSPKDLTVLYAWQVVGHLTVEPTRPFLDLRASDRPTVTLHVSSTRADFRIDRVLVVGGPFAARVSDADGAGRYRIEVRAAPAAAGADGRGGQDPAADRRGALGTVRIRSFASAATMRPSRKRMSRSLLSAPCHPKACRRRRNARRRQRNATDLESDARARIERRLDVTA